MLPQNNNNMIIKKEKNQLFIDINYIYKVPL
jgi:hypothetical protein